MALTDDDEMQPTWKRRLLFSLVFVFGTLAAVAGWLGDVRNIRMARYIAIAGHAAQVIGLLGSMITPDQIEGEPEEVDRDRENF